MTYSYMVLPCNLPAAKVMLDILGYVVVDAESDSERMVGLELSIEHDSESTEDEEYKMTTDERAMLNMLGEVK